MKISRKSKRPRWRPVNHRNMHWASRQLAARREKWTRTFSFEMRMVFSDKPATNACIWRQRDRLERMKRHARRNAPKWPPFWSYPPQYTKPSKPVEWGALLSMSAEEQGELV